jgi:predicted GTPase
MPIPLGFQEIRKSAMQTDMTRIAMLQQLAPRTTMAMAISTLIAATGAELQRLLEVIATTQHRASTRVRRKSVMDLMTIATAEPTPTTKRA